MKSFQERQAQWQQVINVWRASGLGVRDFCKQQGMEEKRLYYWRRRLATRPDGAEVKLKSSQPALKFLPVQIKDVPSTHCNNTQAPPKIEVFFGNGALVRVSGQLSDDKVAGILRLAAGASC